MSTPLYRLVYRSRPAIEGSDEDLRRQLGAILRASRRRNPELDVTGALTLRDGSFVQVLEGPLRAVESVFELICRDERHDAVTLLELSPIEARGFGDWSMAWADLAGDATGAAAALPAATTANGEAVQVLAELHAALAQPRAPH